MSDKKIIIIALILAVLVIGGGWYYSQHGSQKAAISSPQQSSSQTPKATEPGVSYGDPNAPVVIEEYASFLCSACANFDQQTFPSIKNNYVATGKVRFVFYNLAPNETAKAGLCADEQNKFIEYADYTYSHQTQIAGESDLQTFATNIGLDMEKFNACYSSTKYDAKIDKWSSDAQARGVEYTPTFFINGQKFVGAQPYSEFQKLIDQKLNQ